MSIALLFIISAAFFDGISTIQQVFIMLFLLSTSKPVKNALQFTNGVFTAYLFCGIAGIFFADKLSSLFKYLNPVSDKLPDFNYYQIQLVVGIVLLISGPIYLLNLKNRKKRMNKLIFEMQKITPVTSFIIGAVISSTSFPFAVPYLLSIQKISTLHSGKVMEIAMIFLYNFVYILPMIVPLTLYLILRNHMNEVEDWLHLHTERVNVVVTIFMLFGLGILFIADAGLYFTTAHPLIRERILM